MFRSALFALAGALLLLAAPARADDVYYSIRLTELTLVDGELPADSQGFRRWELIDLVRPYAALDGPGEAYISDEANDRFNWSARTASLVLRAPEGAEITGSLFLPDQKWSTLIPVRFSIAPEAAAPDAETDAETQFLRARASHYDRLWSLEAPGAAYFRYQADMARRQLGEDAPARNFVPRRGQDFTDTYNLFNGGRAVSENLQLHRGLQDQPGANAQPPEDDVALDSLEGITVGEFDWASMLAEIPQKPTLDALAAAIPADQHAAFLPSFAALMTVLDETEEDGLPIFRSLTPRSEDANLIARYERQLCLPRTALARRLGPAMIRSIAITGSDPYFPTGTDVAILFEAIEPDSLHTFLAQSILAAGQIESVELARGTIGDIDYQGATSPDRAISSYIAAIDSTIIITNSLSQLERLAAVHAGETPSLASLLEYQFFRARYRRGDENETAFLFLSDPTIRRWCGPEWRIASSRRLRAHAIMADVTAAHADTLARGLDERKPVKADTPMDTIGDLHIGPLGVSSSVYGYTSFLTPIAELDIKTVTKAEANSYRRWREQYQQNWSWAFDPIGIRFGIDNQQLRADMTVMPLILGSQYRSWLEVAQGATIGAAAGDPHDAIAHAAFAINVKSRAVQETTGFARMMAPDLEIDPIGWLGESVAIYADPDPFWQEMLSAEDADEFLQQASEYPVALHAEVSSALKLTAFLAAARSFIEQTVPDMTAWENRKHNDRTYVRIGLSEQARAEAAGGAFDDLGVYYYAGARGLTISLSESVLQRAIDRQVERLQPDAAPAAESHWLGESMALRFTQEGLALIQGPGREERRTAMQVLAWLNLPILNEWKQRFPDQDPLDIHERLWGARLVCPGGGDYIWDEQFHTMASTLYGHPGKPLPGPEGLGPLSIIRSGNLGITFEEDGLRARAILEREAESP